MVFKIHEHHPVAVEFFEAIASQSADTPHKVKLLQRKPVDGGAIDGVQKH